MNETRAQAIAGAIAAAVFVVSCGQSVRSDDATKSGGAANAGSTAGGAGGAAGSTLGGSSGDAGSTQGGSSGAGGSSSGAGGAGGSGGATDDRLLPLEIGRRWTFELTAIDPGMPTMNCSEVLESTVPGTVTRNGEEGFEYLPACGQVSASMFIDGDEIRAYPNSGDLFLYAMPPVEEGATWDTGSGFMAVWHDEGSIDVPAGSFDRCWRRSWLPDETGYAVFCRGVGVVVVNAGADNYRLELSSKSF